MGESAISSKRRRPSVPALAQRLRSRAVRDHVPLELQLAAGRLQSRAEWSGNRAARPAKLARAELLLSDMPGPVPDLALVARRNGLVANLSNILTFQQQLLDQVETVGSQYADLALDDPRGVLFATIHSPTQWISARVAHESQVALSIVVGEWMSRAEKPVPETLLLQAGGAFQTVMDTLDAGGNCALLFDVPGETEVLFMNKQASLRNGIGRLSAQTGVPVVPTLVAWDGARPTIHYWPLIEPADRSSEDILQEIADVFTGILAERPELWQPHTSQLWPEKHTAYRWAFPY